MTRINTSRTMFFQKVAQLEITIASPKQPQSVTLLVRASINVVTVKNDIINSNNHAANLRQQLANINTPTKNSDVIIATLKNVAIGNAHSNEKLPIVQAVIYSCILYDVPRGSTPFEKLENKNTKPTIKRLIV